MTGWECPKCWHVYAPFVTECSRCGADKAVTITDTGTYPVSPFEWPTTVPIVTNGHGNCACPQCVPWTYTSAVQ